MKEGDVVMEGRLTDIVSWQKYEYLYRYEDEDEAPVVTPSPSKKKTTSSSKSEPSWEGPNWPKNLREKPHLTVKNSEGRKGHFDRQPLGRTSTWSDLNNQSCYGQADDTTR